MSRNFICQEKPFGALRADWRAYTESIQMRFYWMIIFEPNDNFFGWLRRSFICNILSLSLSWLRSLLYRNQSINLLCKSMAWFLYNRDHCHEIVNYGFSLISDFSFCIWVISNQSFAVTCIISGTCKTLSNVYDGGFFYRPNIVNYFRKNAPSCIFGIVLNALLIYIRFMICCDKCEEWFHGDCVGVSMAKGREMEKTGEEWCCKVCRGRKHCTKKFSIEDFFSKCDQIRRELRLWSDLLKKFLIENFIFCAVKTYLPSKIWFCLSWPILWQCSISIPPGKKENLCFLAFLGGIEKEHWREIILRSFIVFKLM